MHKRSSTRLVYIFQPIYYSTWIGFRTMLYLYISLRCIYCITISVRSPSYTSKVIKKDPKKSQNCMKARYKELVHCCSLSEPHCIELQNAAVTEQIETVWVFVGKEWKNLHRLICPAQEMFSRSGYTAAEGSMCDSRAAPRSCSGSSSYVFACRCNATVRKQAFGREVTELEPERNKDCLWGFHLPI